MAYNGYLVKIKNDTYGDYTLPLNIIEAETFISSIHGQDLDPFTNTDGVTYRNALANVKPTASWALCDGITQTKFWSMMAEIQKRYKNAKEKRVSASVWFAEINGYITHDFYLPDIEFTISEIDSKKNEIYYDSITMELISYGGAV